MATVHFGNGQPVASLGAALAAAGNGGTVISHGPFTENLTTTAWTWNDVTWKHMGGDYTFDGGGATLDCIKITGTGNRLIMSTGAGRVKITGYGRYVLWIDALGNVIEDPYLDSNGYAAAGDCYHYLCTARTTLLRPVINVGTDNNASHYGLTFDGSSGGTVQNALVARLQTTAVAGEIVGLQSLNACGRPNIDGYTIHNCTATNDYTSIRYGGAGAGDVMDVRRFLEYDNAGGGTVIRVHADSVGMKLEDFIIRGDGTGIGILSEAAAVFAGNNNNIWNGVVYNCATGVKTDSNVDGSQPDIRNVIARDCVGRGFWSIGTHGPTNSNCLYYNNGTPGFVGWTSGLGNIPGRDPMHTDAASGDFSLLVGSPCIDAGIAVTGRTADFDDNPISGTAWDIGPLEYQFSYPLWEFARDYVLPGQYEASTRLHDWIRSMLGAVGIKTLAEELYDVFADLKANQWLATATGVGLDRLGKILGYSRSGLSDADYRLRLYIQAAINTSNGRPEQIIDLMNAIFSTIWIQILEPPPDWTPSDVQTARFYVCMKMAAAGALPENITDLAQMIAPAGVSAWVTSAEELTPHGFSDDSRADGFDEVDAFHVPEGNGGALVELYPKT